MIKLTWVLVLALLVAGCTTQSPGQTSDVQNSDGSITKSDGTIVKPDGSMVKPDGTMVAIDGTMTKPDGTMVKPDGSVVEAGPEADAMMEKDGAVSFTGETIAGSTTPYLRFNQADFDSAKAQGKAVYVYVYATWCPTCARERPSVLRAFDSAAIENAVGFEVHWKDGQNTAEDEAFARTYGVGSQHTHLFFDSAGNLVEKTQSSLSESVLQSKLQALA